MGRLDGQVAFITGAARGQGRSHAVRLAQEGADIIAVDICAQIDTVPYPMATPEDLAETVALVEAEGRRIVAEQADVRDLAALQAALARGVGELGDVSIVIANAGIVAMGGRRNPPEQQWADVLAVNLTGVWNTVWAALPSMRARGEGGSIVLISSTSGLKGNGGPNAAGHAYVASKHGVVGLMRTLANELARERIRVNTVHPTGVATPMVLNEAVAGWLAKMPDFGATMQNALPVELIEPIDVSNAIVWLVSDDARYVTGITLPVDAGFTNR